VGDGGVRAGPPEEAPAPQTRAPEAPAWTRWLVRSFVALFIVCGVVGLELWPLSGFRLFSHLRHEHQTAWTARAVDQAGRERAVRFASFPAAFRGFGLIMQRFQELAPNERRRTCRTWLDQARRVQGPVQALRMYRLSWDALPRDGDRPASVIRTLTYACS
jgi:hypothetical protein